MKNWIINLWHNLEEHLNKPWFPWVVGFVFFIDHFILFVPLDALLVTSVIAAPRRWIALFVGAATGFALGAILFAYLVQLYGLGLVERLTPGITHHAVWMQSEVWMHHYGLLAVGVFSMIPLTCDFILTSLRGVTEPVATVFFTIDVSKALVVLNTSGGF